MQTGDRRVLKFVDKLALRECCMDSYRQKLGLIAFTGLDTCLSHGWYITSNCKILSHFGGNNLDLDFFFAI